MKLISRVLITVLFLSAVFGFATTSQAKDIVPGSALEKEMNEMIKRGVLTGFTDGTYRPTENVTRAQFAAFINRALELPAGVHTFKDVSPNSKLADDVGAVYAAGIMQGKSLDSFYPDALITREQVAITIENAMNYMKLDLNQKRLEFTDANQMSSITLKAVFNIANYNIVQGYPNSNTSPVTYSFKPKHNATREQAAAFIYRLILALEKVEEQVPEPTPDPEMDETLFYLGYVENGKLVVQQYGHQTYAKAVESFNSVPSAKAILKGDEIIRIKSGFAFGNRTTIKDGKAVREVTTVYFDTEFKRQATYVEHGREIRYLDANEQFAKVQVGGTIGYVKHNEVDFVPMEMVTDRDYYMVNQWGTLSHHQYNYVTKSRGSYSIGPAPAGLTSNVRYYSQDGVHFADAAGKLRATHYPYFQYLSVRTKTSYTAQELDSFIADRLTTLNTSSGMYKDAVTKSKLINKGKYFIEMQEKYNVNALFILAAAMHESANGMSVNAQEKNNLFGIRVFDGSPHEGTVYAQPEGSIDAFAREYMNRNYANPLGAYANGAVPGNKTSGFNVSYASDPTWGAKIAGHMFRADLALGKKDIHKHKLGITNTPKTNVRSAPNGTLLYTFKRDALGINNAFGYPVVIVEKTQTKDAAGFHWYKVISDSNPENDTNNGFGWIREDLINEIN